MCTGRRRRTIGGAGRSAAGAWKSCIAVAVAATGMAASEEGRLFRITLKHSIALALFMAVVTMIFAYVLPELVPQVDR